MALPVRYNVLSLLARPTSTLSSIALIGLVIAVFCYLQAVTESAFTAMTKAGDPRTVIALAESADTESVSAMPRDSVDKLAQAPGAVADEKGPIVSAEIVAIASAFTDASETVALNTAVRGVDFERANRVRHGAIKIIEGRPFQEGLFEVIVGEQAARLFRGYRVGGEVQLGTRGMRPFKIVGIFSTGGSAADSEILGYVETLRDVYNRSGYSSARLLAADEQSAKAIAEFVSGPSVGMTGKSEREYFSKVSTNQQATQALSAIMIVLMGIAAAFAVANTMYAAVAGRTREIGMLRAVGFPGVSVLTAFVIEGVLLAAAGGALGCALSLVVNGMQRNVLPNTFTTMSYSLQITWKIVAVSMAVALGIGLCGSIMPAARAARLQVIQALREA